MKFISLFAGIGGFDLALERLGHKCVYANDIDKYSKITYDKHFSPSLDLRDIRTVGNEEISDHDILCGGFPCQAFSIAGKRGGFEDTRGTLFHEIARIADAKRPAYLFLENVKGLLSHDDGRTFETILRTFTELGYELQWQVCNSKDFGVPQNRERVFIIGSLRGKPRPKVFPFGENNRNHLKEITSKVSISQRIYDPSGISQTINGLGGGGGAKTGLYAQRVPLKFLNRNQRNIEGDYAYTVDSLNTGGVMVNKDIRRLTPTECERLQGFPDGWTEGVSDTQRYKQLGNAVTVNVVQEIAGRLA